jgi:futalosine hydrolase
MRILIVAATMGEIVPLIGGLTTPRLLETGALPQQFSHAGHSVDFAVTGVGMVATAVNCTRALVRGRYDVALNIGVCGSFDRALSPGAVVHVTSERLSELGAEDGDRFLPAQEIGLLRDDLFVGGALTNPRPPSNVVLATLKAVRGITVNTVHGHEPTIAEIVRRLDPQVESMEGAAFFYACLTHGVAFAEVRAVSNMVERRNRGSWRMPEAIEQLCATARAIIDAV